MLEFLSGFSRSDWIATVALVVSTLSLAISYSDHRKANFNLQVAFHDDDSFYMEPLETYSGNRSSLIVHCKISNASSQPITIDNAYVLANTPDVYMPATSDKEYPYPEHLGDETFTTRNDSGYLMVVSRHCGFDKLICL